jgi:hypothetical protein
MEWSTSHDCDDCLTGVCQHPDHHLLDCDVDLDYLLSLALHRQRFDELLPETAWAPVIL